ncbi:transcription termination/antitermination protein NusG [Candidatus Dependentiae bacterium]
MKRWYVVQVFAGYEEAVKADLEKHIKESELQDSFGEILIPSAKMKSFFESVDEAKDQQLFPGYLLVEMELGPETFRFVLESPRAFRFLGGKNPMPLSKKEIEKIISQMKGEVIVSSEKEGFAVEAEVDISEGPFAGFVGVIDKIDYENEKLTVMVSIFGRMTPVELRFNQVKK